MSRSNTSIRSRPKGERSQQPAPKKSVARRQTSQTVVSSEGSKLSGRDILNELLRDQFSITQLYPIQEGLLSCFDDVQKDDLSTSDLHLHSRDGSGKMLGYLLFLLNKCLQRRFSIASQHAKQGVMLVLAPDVTRQDLIHNVFANFATKTTKYGMLMHVTTLSKASCFEINSGQTFIVTTPAVLASAEQLERLKPFVHAIVFDRADTMNSDESIRNICNIVQATIAEDQEFARRVQIILASSCYSANVLRIKELLRSPLVVTLEESTEECTPDEEKHEIPPKFVLEEEPMKDVLVNRDIKHYLLGVENSIDRYTWLYCIIKRTFEKHVGQGLCPKLVIVAADLQTSYKLKVFFEALSIPAEVFHRLLSKRSEEVLRKGFAKKTPSVIIVSESIEEYFLDVGKCETFVEFATHVVNFTRQQGSLESFDSRYHNTCEYFSSRVPRSGKAALPLEIITILSLREENPLFQLLENYIRHNTATGALEGSHEVKSILYQDVSEAYMKAMKYRCEDVFHSKCSLRSIRQQMAKMIGKEMEMVKKETQSPESKQLKRKKLTRDRRQKVARRR